MYIDWFHWKRCYMHCSASNLNLVGLDSDTALGKHVCIHQKLLHKGCRDDSKPFYKKRKKKRKRKKKMQPF